MSRVLDDNDEAVWAQTFLLADAVRRFLARRQTQKIIDAGLLDADVVKDLVDANDRMWLARTDRITEARLRNREDPS